MRYGPDHDAATRRVVAAPVIVAPDVEPIRAWTIYHDASDVQLPYAALEWLLDGTGPRPGRLWAALTLEAARERVPGRFDRCLPRAADDDPAIVESWI